MRLWSVHAQAKVDLAYTSNPNARYNCSLSHAELLLLVDKSKEAEADKKKKDMLELISAAQMCGALPPAVATC
mgnify:CR=1 FL=1